MIKSVSVPIIGYLSSPFKQKFSIPRQSSLVQVEAHIELIPPYNNPQAFTGLEAYSHLWLIWQFHAIPMTDFRPMIRPPRLGGNKKIGVFASRSMFRPSRLGMSAVKLLAIEPSSTGVRLKVSGVDILDGTPIVDIKPYLKYTDCIENAQSDFAAEAPKSQPVTWHTKALKQAEQLISIGILQQDQTAVITALIAQNPRPAYHQQNREYGMSFSKFNIRFVFYQDQIEIQSIAIQALESNIEYCEPKS